jgi:acid phosphatase class B
MVFLLSIWGVVFSVATIAKLDVGFGYDTTLVCSTLAYQKAIAQELQPDSYSFWAMVNESYDLERPKIVPLTIAWIFRVFGFRVVILTSRPAINTEGLKKDWRHLAAPSRFIFAETTDAKVQYLENGNFFLFFGGSDSEIEAAQKAHIYPIRILQSRECLYNPNDYHPGQFGELKVPLSQY